MKHKILADLHTHTIGSLHAYSTIKENITSAKENGLEFIAITDHLFYHEDRMQRLNEIARIHDLHKIENKSSVAIIPGTEGNLNQNLSNEDVNTINSNTTWRPVGAHSFFLNTSFTNVKTIPEHFKACIDNDMNVKPTAFAHIERGLSSFMLGHDRNILKQVLYDIVDVAVKNDIFLEINAGSTTYGESTVELMKVWIPYAKEKRAKFCLGTDAHYCDSVGDFSSVREFIDEIDGAYVLNYDRDALSKLLMK